MNDLAISQTQETSSPTKQPQKAVIYCRVSSKKQTEAGSGLESQEHRCREYANRHGYDVEAVFPDDVSGGGDFMKRPGMVALLAYLNAQSAHQYVVIFDDLKRFARDTEFHIKLRREFILRKAKVECLNFKFDDTPEGKFIETIFAAHGALEREQNGRQVVQKMKARIEQGYWCFQAPVGYRYTKSKRGGKELIRNEPMASIVQEALEGFASGRFDTQTEVARFLETHSEFPNDLPNGKVRVWKATRILTSPVYAGYISAPKWNVSLRKAQHEGLISYKTFLKIQERLKAGALAPARKDINLDFPLRGFVTCGDCGTPLRSCWSKGKCKKYPYYLCSTKDCASYGKSIRRADIEGEFEALLKRMRPSASLFKLLGAMLEGAWKQQLAQMNDWRKDVRKDVLKIEKQIDQFLDRIVETSSRITIKAYERKIASLENEKLLASEKLENSFKPKATYGQMLELSMRFLANPCKLWESGNINLQKLVLRLAFSERLAYHRIEGYRTPKTTLPFKVLGGFEGDSKAMVHPARFELTTSAFGGQRSIQLSYGCIGANFCG